MEVSERRYGWCGVDKCEMRALVTNAHMCLCGIAGDGASDTYDKLHGGLSVGVFTALPPAAHHEHDTRRSG